MQSCHGTAFFGDFADIREGFDTISGNGVAGVIAVADAVKQATAPRDDAIGRDDPPPGG